MSENKEPDETAGCGLMILAAAIFITLVLWAIQGFPKFWESTRKVEKVSKILVINYARHITGIS